VKRVCSINKAQNNFSRSFFDDGYFWDSMKKDCNDIVATCKECLSFNVAQSRFSLSSIAAKLSFDHVTIDLFAPLPVSSAGHTYSLVLSNSNKVPLSYIAQRQNSRAVAHTLFAWFCTFGFPKILQSDNGTEFVNDLSRDLCTKLVSLND
jgi:hypothetical protein